MVRFQARQPNLKEIFYLAMPLATKEEQKKYQHEWYLRTVKARKELYFKTNGPCCKCGSWIKLQLDHVDRLRKISHNIRGWEKEKRSTELLKCQILCHECRKKKTILECYPERKHGSQTMYEAGCRCQSCRASNAKTKRNYRARTGKR